MGVTTESSPEVKPWRCTCCGAKRRGLRARYFGLDEQWVSYCHECKPFVQEKIDASGYRTIAGRRANVC